MPVNKKLTHAERAERYAEKCANKEIEVPAQVSKAYAKWFDYKKEFEFKPENLTSACQLIENSMPSDSDADQPELPEAYCAFLSWPLVFVDAEGKRAVKQLRLFSKKAKNGNISILMAGLMLSELADPFRGGSGKGVFYKPPFIVAAGPSQDQARSFLDEAQRILMHNSRFRAACGILHRKERLEATQPKGVIKPYGIKTSGFALRRGTAVFVDDTSLVRDAQYVSKARADAGSLLVTNGVLGRIPRRLFGSAEFEAKRSKLKEQPIDGLVYLIY